MLFSLQSSRLRFTWLLSWPLALILATPALPSLAQSDSGEPLEEDLSDPNNLRPLTQADSLLSTAGGERLVAEANTALEQENYDLAAQKFKQARQVFNQLTNFYQQLSRVFSGIDNDISSAHRRSALVTAQRRDESTYQLALVHKANQQPELAVPLLIQIVRSQNPTQDLGRQAYQELFSLGFVDMNYPPGEVEETEDNDTEGTTETEETRPLKLSSSILSIPGGERLMAEAIAAVDQQDYGLAAQKLQQARQIFNQLTNFYQQLEASFSGIDGEVAGAQRRNALNTAQKRDESTYQLALVHRAANQPELAVPLLVQIVRSQNPTTQLGEKAYKQLRELGFVDRPFPS